MSNFDTSSSARFRWIVCILLAIISTMPLNSHAQGYLRQFNAGKNQNINLGAASKTFCILSKINAQAGYGLSARVVPDKKGSWRLYTEEANAKALCLPLSRFQFVFSDEGTYVRWISKVGSVEASPGLSCDFFAGCTRDSSKPRLEQVPLWNGDAMTMLQGYSGSGEGGAEYAGISQATSASTASTVLAHSSNGTIQGWGISLFVGVPHTGGRPTYHGPNGSGPINLAGTFTVASDGQHTKYMTPVANTLCFFTKIGGKFRGGDESVEIFYTDDGHGVVRWVLRASASGSEYTTATAACARYVQEPYKSTLSPN